MLAMSYNLRVVAATTNTRTLHKLLLLAMGHIRPPSLQRATEKQNDMKLSALQIIQ